MGTSWEGWVIEQILIYLKQHDLSHDASFVRTKEGLEADLVLDLGRERWALEVKFTSEPSSEDPRVLEKAGALVKATRLALICRVTAPVDAGRTKILPLKDFLSLLTP